MSQFPLLDGVFLYRCALATGVPQLHPDQAVPSYSASPVEWEAVLAAHGEGTQREDYTAMEANSRHFVENHLRRQKEQLEQFYRFRCYRNKLLEAPQRGRELEKQLEVLKDHYLQGGEGEDYNDYDEDVYDDATIQHDRLNGDTFSINDNSFSPVSSSGYFIMIPFPKRSPCRPQEGKEGGPVSSSSSLVHREDYYYGYAFYFTGKPLLNVEQGDGFRKVGGYLLCLVSTSPIFRTLRKLSKEMVLLLCQQAIEVHRWMGTTQGRGEGEKKKELASLFHTTLTTVVVKQFLNPLSSVNQLLPGNSMEVPWTHLLRYLERGSTNSKPTLRLTRPLDLLHPSADCPLNVLLLSFPFVSIKLLHSLLLQEKKIVVVSNARQAYQLCSALVVTLPSLLLPLVYGGNVVPYLPFQDEYRRSTHRSCTRESMMGMTVEEREQATQAATAQSLVMGELLDALLLAQSHTPTKDLMELAAASKRTGNENNSFILGTDATIVPYLTLRISAALASWLEVHSDPQGSPTTSLGPGVFEEVWIADARTGTVAPLPIEENVKRRVRATFPNANNINNNNNTTPTPNYSKPGSVIEIALPPGSDKLKANISKLASEAQRKRFRYFLEEEEKRRNHFFWKREKREKAFYEAYCRYVLHWDTLVEEATAATLRDNDDDEDHNNDDNNRKSEVEKFLESRGGGLPQRINSVGLGNNNFIGNDTFCFNPSMMVLMNTNNNSNNSSGNSTSTFPVLSTNVVFDFLNSFLDYNSSRLCGPYRRGLSTTTESPDTSRRNVFSLDIPSPHGHTAMTLDPSQFLLSLCDNESYLYHQLVYYSKSFQHFCLSLLHLERSGIMRVFKGECVDEAMNAKREQKNMDTDIFLVRPRYINMFMLFLIKSYNRFGGELFFDLNRNSQFRNESLLVEQFQKNCNRYIVFTNDHNQHDNFSAVQQAVRQLTRRINIKETLSSVGEGGNPNGEQILNAEYDEYEEEEGGGGVSNKGKGNKRKGLRKLFSRASKAIKHSMHSGSAGGHCVWFRFIKNNDYFTSILLQNGNNSNNNNVNANLTALFHHFNANINYYYIQNFNSLFSYRHDLSSNNRRNNSSKTIAERCQDTQWQIQSGIETEMVYKEQAIQPNHSSHSSDTNNVTITMNSSINNNNNTNRAPPSITDEESFRQFSHQVGNESFSALRRLNQQDKDSTKDYSELTTRSLSLDVIYQFDAYHPLLNPFPHRHGGGGEVKKEFPHHPYNPYTGLYLPSLLRPTPPAPEGSSRPTDLSREMMQTFDGYLLLFPSLTLLHSRAPALQQTLEATVVAVKDDHPDTKEAIIHDDEIVLEDSPHTSPNQSATLFAPPPPLEDLMCFHPTTTNNNNNSNDNTKTGPDPNSVWDQFTSGVPSDTTPLPPPSAADGSGSGVDEWGSWGLKAPPTVTAPVRLPPTGNTLDELFSDDFGTGGVQQKNTGKTVTKQDIDDFFNS